MSEQRQNARFLLWCNIYEWECKSGAKGTAASHAAKAVAAFDKQFKKMPKPKLEPSKTPQAAGPETLPRT